MEISRGALYAPGPGGEQPPRRVRGGGGVQGSPLAPLPGGSGARSLESYLAEPSRKLSPIKQGGRRQALSMRPTEHTLVGANMSNLRCPTSSFCHRSHS